MNKSPDEIKKGLECCSKDECFGEREDCPYKGKPGLCVGEMCVDALALIQQLQDDNAEKTETIMWMEAERDDLKRTIRKLEDHLREVAKKIEQLQAERDAAVRDVRLTSTLYVGTCQTCKHCKNQVDCDEPEACGLCKVEDCPCRTCCEDASNWEWRGVQKEGFKMCEDYGSNISMSDVNHRALRPESQKEDSNA